MSLEYLSNVHTRWNTEGVQDHIHRGAILKVWHVFNRHNLGDYTLVSVTTGHLVTDLKLALDGHVNLDQLDDTRGEFVAFLVTFDLGQVAIANLVLFLADLVHQVPDAFFNVLTILDGDPLVLLELESAKVGGRKDLTLLQQFRTRVVDNLSAGLPICEQANQLTIRGLTNRSNVLIPVPVDPGDSLLFNLERPLVLLNTFAREHLCTHDDTLNTRGNPK